MRGILLNVLGIVFFAVGCVVPSPNTEVDPDDQNSGPLLVESIAADSVMICPEWQIDELDAIVDSALSQAYGERVHFKPRLTVFERWGSVDSIGALPDQVLQALAQDGLRLRWFDPDRSRNAHVKLELACFKNDSAARACFQLLIRNATAREISPPGLTYTNDDVRLLGRSIAWFNSPCRLSIQNHHKLAELLFERVGFEKANQKIECSCGHVICKILK